MSLSAAGWRCFFHQIGADALDALADGFRLDDLEAAHAGGVRYMRAAADLLGILPSHRTA